ncbi:MAG: 2-oxoacid:ferredoxin oxidoreductase subunit beta [Tissierellia bacterium]|nr:2-oxoacid:ferredoxin oxidoreductase subunit beta [Tissierellia bacterium]
MPSKLVRDHFREAHMPHIWCPGCGHGNILQDVARAIDQAELDPKKIVVVSGIGCSSRASGYMNFYTMHTTHGRAIAFATGIKMAKPELHVIVLTGDGDATAIGGNHFIHAARRNIDLTVVVFNNNIYGMTGGQFSPTTPTEKTAATAPYGSIDPNFDIPKLAAAAGATFAARGNNYHPRETTELIRQGLLNKGFSVIDCHSVCPTYYGRNNGMSSAVEMLQYQKDNYITQARAERMTPQEREGKIVVGVVHRDQRPEYTEAYAKLREEAQNAL